MIRHLCFTQFDLFSFGEKCLGIDFKLRFIPRSIFLEQENLVLAKASSFLAWFFFDSKIFDVWCFWVESFSRLIFRLGSSPCLMFWGGNCSHLLFWVKNFPLLMFLDENLSRFIFRLEDYSQVMFWVEIFSDWFFD